MLRRIAAIALLLTVVLAFVASAHAYILQRLVFDPELVSPWRELAVAGVVALAAAVIAEPLAARLLPLRAARWVAWPAVLWMGFAFLLLLSLLASDLLLWTAGSPALAADAGGGDAARRSAGLRATAVLGLALAAGAVGIVSALRPPQLRRVQFEIAGWPRALDGYRIVQLSDLHFGALIGRAFAAQLAERVAELAPDLIAVTGDLADGDAARLADEVAPLAGLRARDGVFFVTGNHDHYSGASAWAARAAALGMRVLRNERVRIGGEQGFDLVGVDDHRGGFAGGPREDLPRALAGRDPARPAILLAHDPSTFKGARRAHIDLQLSGHTHGGQIWPFGLAVRLVVPWVAGPYRDGRAQLYVSRGTGFWGPPMRLFAPAEITELTIRAAA